MVTGCGWTEVRLVSASSHGWWPGGPTGTFWQLLAADRLGMIFPVGDGDDDDHDEDADEDDDEDEDEEMMMMVMYIGDEEVENDDLQKRISVI